MLPFQPVLHPFIACESQDYYAVFKPAGMHSAARAGKGAKPGTDEDGTDLVSWLASALPGHARAFAAQEADRLKSELGMLSRLDRDTSGLILFAREAEVFRRSLDLQAKESMRKFYRLTAFSGGGELAGSRPLRYPLPRPRILDFSWKGFNPEGSVIESRFRSYGARGARVACVTAEFADSEKKPLSPGTYATSLFSMGKSQLEEFARSDFAIDAEAMITAGFRHQIRAHLAWVGQPIAGDRLYGGALASRLYLESHRIEIKARGTEVLVFELYDQVDQAADFPCG